MNQAQTNLITIHVKPEFLDEESWPENGRFTWAYHIEIYNGSDLPVQLLRRYWQITDSNGHLYEVEGEGVIGEQPNIPPRSSYFYSSGCPLPTSQGEMKGHYLMNGAGKGIFIAEIPSFKLESPYI